MADPWVEALAEAYASVPKDVVPLETLEFHHVAIQEAGFPVAVRAVNNTEDIVARLEVGAPQNSGAEVTFIAIPFAFGFPSFEEGQPSQASVRVENIGREVAKYMAAADTLFSPLTVIFRVYLSNDLQTVAMGPFKFIMREITISGAAAEGKVTVVNAQRLKFLRRAYSPREFPAITR